MKYLMLAMVAFALTACSSSGKKSAKDAAAEGDKAAATAEAKKDGKAAADKAKKTMTTSTDAQVTCRLDSDVRELNIENGDSGCVVKYTKFGTANEIATGTKGSDHCQQVVEKVKGNLTTAGFTCN